MAAVTGTAEATLAPVPGIVAKVTVDSVQGVDAALISTAPAVVTLLTHNQSVAFATFAAVIGSRLLRSNCASPVLALLTTKVLAVPKLVPGRLLTTWVSAVAGTAPASASDGITNDASPKMATDTIWFFKAMPLRDLPID